MASVGYPSNLPRYQGNYGLVPLQTFGPSPAAPGMSLEELQANLAKYGVGYPTPAALAQVRMNRQALMDAIGPSGYVGEGPLADRSPGEINRPAPAAAPLTPGEALLQQLLGGGGSQSQMHATLAPYRAGIQSIRDQMGLAAAQTQQNIADIGSWYGQVANMARKGARSGAKADRKMIRAKGKFDKAILAGLGANKDVQRSYAGGSARGAGNLMNLGAINRAYTADSAQNAAEMDAYQKVIQQNLGAQQQMALADKLGELRAAKVSAKSQASTAQQDMLLKILGMSDSSIGGQLLGPALGLQPEGSVGFSGDPVEMSRLNSAISSTAGGLFDSSADGGQPRLGIEDSLAALRSQALGLFGQDAWKDPKFRDAFRAFVQSRFIPQYNDATDQQWSWAGPGQGFYQAQ